MAEEHMPSMLTDRTWVTVQKKTFTRWSNNFLIRRKLRIEDLQTDLSDGLMLINLLEVLSDKVVGKYNKNPKLKPQKMENLQTALKFIAAQGVKLVAIGAEDIHDSNLKLILGLIWTLILRFQIQRGGDDGSAKAALLEWVRKQVAPYGVRPNNFDRDWMDGRILSALTDSLKPGVLPFNSLSKNAMADVERAMDTAHNEFEIPKLMDPQDMVEFPDELAVMTYVSCFRDWELEMARRRAAAEEEERQRKLRTADPSQCYAHGPGLERAATNNEAPFTIQAVNYFGDPLPTGGDDFQIEVQAAEPITAHRKDNNNGTHSCHYLATLPGTLKVAISLRGEPIKGSPYGPVPVVGPDASRTTASGPGVEGARVDKAAPFTIQSRAADGSPVTTGGDPFTVSVVGPDGSQVPVTLKDNKNGTYDGSYVPNKPGTFQVHVNLRDTPIQGSPFQPFMELGNPGQSWAEGPGLQGGETGSNNPFTIHAVDGDGKPVTHGGDPFQVRISGPQEVTPTIKDNNDGTYSVNYGVDAPGNYQIDVSLHGHPIKDSPFHAHFFPDAASTTASGPGVEGARVHRPAPFQIQSRGKNGAPVASGGDPFQVAVRGPAGDSLPVELRDNGNGTYDGSYTPNIPGVHTVEITLNGHQIHSSPFHPLMEAGHAANSWAEGPGLVGGKTGRHNPFTIHSVDADGKPVTHGGDPFQVHISGPQEVTPTIKDNNDGTYSVDYVVENPGNYQVNVTLHGQPIKDSPFNVLIKPDVDPNFCYAEGPGLTHSVDNEPAHFTIYARDGDDKPKTEGGDPFEVTISGPENIVPQVVDNNDGTYSVTYHPDKPGDYQINVTLEGQPIKNAPYAMNCKSGTDAGHSGFSNFSFTIQTRDKHGQNKNFGGDTFEVSATGPAAVNFNTTDNSDGTYTASYHLPQRGNYSITIKFNGKELTNASPYQQSF